MIRPGSMKLCPHVYLPLFTFPKEKEMILLPKSARIEWIGRTNAIGISAQRMVLGNGVDNITEGRICFRIVRDAIPRSVFFADR